VFTLIAMQVPLKFFGHWKLCYTLNRNVICFGTICKSTTFKITLTVYHRVSAGKRKFGLRPLRQAEH
jgi:hypothetical protein